MMPWRFIPKYDVKKDNGRNTIVTPVKTKMALFWVSAMIASSFCSMDRSWKSWCDLGQWNWKRDARDEYAYRVQGLSEIGIESLALRG